MKKRFSTKIWYHLKLVPFDGGMSFLKPNGRVQGEESQNIAVCIQEFSNISNEWKITFAK